MRGAATTGKQFKTRTVENTLAPEWHDTFTFALSKPLDDNATLTVDVFDYERIGRARPLGKCAVPLGVLVRTVRRRLRGGPRTLHPSLTPCMAHALAAAHAAATRAPSGTGTPSRRPLARHR